MPFHKRQQASYDPTAILVSCFSTIITYRIIREYSSQECLAAQKLQQHLPKNTKNIRRIGKSCRNIHAQLLHEEELRSAEHDLHLQVSKRSPKPWTQLIDSTAPKVHITPKTLRALIIAFGEYDFSKKSKWGRRKGQSLDHRDYANNCYWHGLGSRLVHDKLALDALLREEEARCTWQPPALLEENRLGSTSTNESAKSWRHVACSVRERRWRRKKEEIEKVEMLRLMREAVEDVERMWFEWLAVAWEDGRWKLRFEISARAREMEREAVREGRVRWSVCSGSGSSTGDACGSASGCAGEEVV